MIIEIKLEAYRNFNDPTRKLWIIIYSVFVQLFTIVTLYSSINLGNYLSDREIIEILVRSTNTVLILCLPAMTIILTYYCIVSDPTLNIFSVMSTSRTRLLLIKILSLLVIMSVITYINLIVSFTIISLLYFENTLFGFILLTFGFLGFVNLFYVISISFMFLLIESFTNNKTSTLFFPLIVYFIIPFLISSSISFNLLYPEIINLSPTIWFIKSLNNVVFLHSITLLEISLFLGVIVLLSLGMKLFKSIEIY